MKNIIVCLIILTFTACDLKSKKVDNQDINTTEQEVINWRDSLKNDTTGYWAIEYRDSIIISDTIKMLIVDDYPVTDTMISVQCNNGGFPFIDIDGIIDYEKI